MGKVKMNVLTTREPLRGIDNKSGLGRTASCGSSPSTLCCRFIVMGAGRQHLTIGEVLIVYVNNRILNDTTISFLNKIVRLKTVYMPHRTGLQHE